MGRFSVVSWLIPVVTSFIGCGAGALGPVSSSVQSTGVEVPSGSAGARARVAAVLTQPGRSDADRALDGPKQAAEVLAYLDVAPGMNAAVFAPGSGYFMELVARSVGADGRLFARNPPSLLAASGLGQVWEDRLAKPAGALVVRVDDELGKPLAVHWLDLVFLDHEYAKLGARGVDPSAVDATAWDALRQGGRFVVVERDANVEPTRQAIEAQGFHFASEGSFLRSGANPSDWNDPDPAAKRVLLSFVKP